MTLLDSDQEIENGTYTAVLDNVEDDIARLFVEDGETEIGSVHLEIDGTPIESSEQDTLYSIYVDSEKIVRWESMEETTEERKKNAQDRFDQLSEN